MSEPCTHADAGDDVLARLRRSFFEPTALALWRCLDSYPDDNRFTRCPDCGRWREGER